MKLKSKTALFALAFMLFAALTCVSAQEKQDDKPKAEEKETVYEAPKPEKWLTLKSAGLKFGFAKDWETVEFDEHQAAAVSKDDKVKVTILIAEEKTVKEAVANLDKDLANWCDGLKLTDPQESRECHGIKVLSTGGTGTRKGAEADEAVKVDVSVDVIEAAGDDHKIVLFIVSGAHEAMETNAGEIVLAQESFQKAE